MNQELVNKLLDLATRAVITKADNAQEVMKKAAAALSESGWKTADKTPKGKKPVLVKLTDGNYAVREYRVSAWDDVTEWMEIPK